jgi:hypothetical protein
VFQWTGQVGEHQLKGKMRPENKRMQEFLKQNGVQAIPKYLATGSLKGCWRLWGKRQPWTDGLRQRLTALGFVDFNGDPLGQYSGNGGLFCVFVRGHNELLEGM